MDNKLVATEKTKCKSNYPCKKCGLYVIVGVKYISVRYNDAYTKRPYGVFHLDCWSEYLEGGEDKKIEL